MGMVTVYKRAAALFVIAAFLLLCGLRPAISATNPPNVSVVGAFTPSNPISVAETPSASLTAVLTDPSTGQEIPPPDDATYQWSVDMANSSAPPGAVWSVNFQPATGSQTTTATASLGNVGDYAVKIVVTVTSAAWTGNAISNDPCYVFNVQGCVVRFSSNPIITGVSLACPGYLYTTTSATVSPPASAADVQLVVQGPGGRATCTVLGSDAGSGIIAFKIAGTSASPNPTPAGDTTLSALMGGNVVGSAAVLVVVPQFVTPADATAQYLSTGYPGAQSPASVPWQGAALNNTTSPADTQATAPMVDLDVTATIPEPVYVFDQFQSPLNAVYNGDVVSEQDGEGNNVPINQNVYNGAYTDPVGYLLMSGTTVDSSTPAGQAQIQQWLNSPAVGTLVLGNLPGSVYVTIAGEPLSELVNGTTSPFVRREVVCAGSTQNSLLLYIRHI